VCVYKAKIIINWREAVRQNSLQIFNTVPGVITRVDRSGHAWRLYETGGPVSIG